MGLGSVQAACGTDASLVLLAQLSEDLVPSKKQHGPLLDVRKLLAHELQARVHL